MHAQISIYDQGVHRLHIAANAYRSRSGCTVPQVYLSSACNTLWLSTSFGTKLDQLPPCHPDIGKSRAQAIRKGVAAVIPRAQLHCISEPRGTGHPFSPKGLVCVCQRLHQLAVNILCLCQHDCISLLMRSRLFSLASAWLGARAASVFMV